MIYRIILNSIILLFKEMIKQMVVSKEVREILNSPDTIDFVARHSDFFIDFVKDKPHILLTQVLSGRYILGYTDRLHYQELIEALGTGFISSTSSILGTLDRPALESAGIIQVQNQPYLDLTGRGVLIGFIDTGIDYTQKVFINEDGTSKIQYIYDQTVTGDEIYDDFYIGTEYTNEQINLALKSDDPYSVVPQRDTSGHGTFLASLAAGKQFDDYLGAAPNADIIAVKLKKARPFYLERYCVPPEQENAFGSSSVMVGVEYILRKARALNKPVVICLGIGTNTGSHDGFSIFEEYLSNISNLKGVCLCTSAGNECQERHHTQGSISTQGETQNIDLKVGDDAGGIFLTIWNGISDRFSVAIRSPTGELVSRVPARPNATLETQLVLEKSSVTVEYHFPVEGSGGQLTVVRILNATPGIWTLTLFGDIVLDGTYHAWLPITGFISPTVEFLAASPYCTTTIPATMFGSICCGAYNSISNSLYIKSSWGPTRSPAMSPDLTAPGVNIGGYYPYGYGVMSGTSAAAAITAGACALLLEWGIVDQNDISLSTFQIRAYLIRGCTRNDAMDYPNFQWGYGMLNLMRTFHLMREL